MKKFKYLLLCLISVFTLTACNLYVLDDYTNNGSDNSDSTNTSTSTSPSTGTTIITSGINYTGFINYTEEIPTTNNSWDDIYEQVRSSVVTIRNIVNGNTSSTGSGVFFAEDSMTNGYAYIFTNAHVVTGATSIEVLLSNSTLVQGTIVGYDTNEDVAVIQIPKRNDYTIATLRKSSTLRIGEEILTIGSPLGEKYSETATSGIISNLNIAITPDESTIDLYLIQIDAALNPGNSGGPLFDNNGNLIGINTIKLVSSETTDNIESFNYAIPISHFSLVANYLLQGSLYYRPFLNITIIDIRLLNMSERSYYDLEINKGLLITDIGNTSPLKNKATNGQVITHIENVEVSKATDFSVELLKYAPNETITLTICNADGTNSKNIDITLLKR